MEGVDRISDLPDSILTHILSFLSTEEAFRTSFLSTRWRDLFTFVSNLEFEFVEQHINWHNNPDVKGFMCFVDRVLFFHTGNVDKFRLKFGKWVDSDRIYGWISAAVRRGVKHLDINIALNKLTLPYALFTCRTLVTLKLESGFILDVPKSVYFPNLVTLQLYKVVFLNDDSVSSLFSGCIGLQDVIVSHCNMKNISFFNVSHNFLKELTISFSDHSSDCWLMIDTPNLAYFRYYDHASAGYSLENLKSIVKADISFRGIYEDVEADITPFFKGISMAISLSLTPMSLELLLNCAQLPVFPVMHELRIVDEPIEDLYWLDSMNRGLETLLSRTPELEQLSFSQELLISLPEQVPSCLLFKLKSIEILDFKDYKDCNCIRKAKYILKNGGALENFTICTYLDEEDRSNMSKVLLASPRKSNHCKLIILALP